MVGIEQRIEKLDERIKDLEEQIKHILWFYKTLQVPIMQIEQNKKSIKITVHAFDGETAEKIIHFLKEELFEPIELEP